MKGNDQCFKKVLWEDSHSQAVLFQVPPPVNPSYIAEDNHLSESNKESALLTRGYHPPNTCFRGGAYI